MWMTKDGRANTVAVPPGYFQRENEMRGLLAQLDDEQRERLGEEIERSVEALAELILAPGAFQVGSAVDEIVPESVLNAIDWPEVLNATPNFASVDAVEDVWRLDVLTYLDEMR